MRPKADLQRNHFMLRSQPALLPFAAHARFVLQTNSANGRGMRRGRSQAISIVLVVIGFWDIPEPDKEAR